MRGEKRIEMRSAGTTRGGGGGGGGRGGRGERGWGGGGGGGGVDGRGGGVLGGGGGGGWSTILVLANIVRHLINLYLGATSYK